MSSKTVLQERLTKMPGKKCQVRVSSKKCLTRVSSQCLTRVSSKNVKQECQVRSVN